MQETELVPWCTKFKCWVFTFVVSKCKLDATNRMSAMVQQIQMWGFPRLLDSGDH